MKDNVFIGIDPGSVSGCICYMKGDLIEFCRVSKSTEKDIAVFLQQSVEHAELDGVEITAIIEGVHAMPTQGVSSVFKFGENFGFMKGVLVSCSIPYGTVSPVKWMNFYNLRNTEKLPRPQWKKLLRQRAEQLFPHLTIHADEADALLIAFYLKNNGI